MEGIGGEEQVAQAVAGFACLAPSFGGELHAVVGGVLVDVAVLWGLVSL